MSGNFKISYRIYRIQRKYATNQPEVVFMSNRQNLREEINETIDHTMGVIRELEEEINSESIDIEEVVRLGELVGIARSNLQDYKTDYGKKCMERDKMEEYRDVVLDISALNKRFEKVRGDVGE